MRVSLKWLIDYLNITVSPSELANRLMMSGNEVKTIETIGAGWDNVVIGQVTAISPHPNADRLRLATVDTGKGQQTVVCGAFNFTAGDKIAFASIGAELIDGHTGQQVRLKAAKIRGVESKGMLCSEKELGISQDHTGIMVLPADAPVGVPLHEYLGDTVIDLDVTPNRPDCLSVIGIARESAALTGQGINIPAVDYIESSIPIGEKISVEIRDPDLCPRYCASLITGIQIRPSPKWMQDRLIASGLRPINNIVDISNYVMLEYGQPLHTFDYDKIAGQKIVVRRASEGEVIVSLDGIERKLNPEMLVIADAGRAVAVAGVMGGANTEVTESTRNILLEAASFKPESIYYTGNALGLSSESRYRFERGIAAGLTLPALKRATQLIADLGSGKVARGWIDVYPGETPVRPILLSTEKMKRLLGVEFGLQQVTDTLASLGFECRETASPFQIEVTAPYWRSDIHIEVDLIEEVSRILGYDKIPSTLLAEPLPRMNPDPVFNLKRDVRLGLAASGFSEVINFSLVGIDILRKLSSEHELVGPPPLRVANPMTADMEYLRTTLRASLLSSFASNRRYTEESIRLFEVGKIYLRRDKGLPDERETVCGVMGGLRYARSWQDNGEILDFFDAKGIAEGLMQKFGLDYRFEKGQDTGLHPNKQATIFLEDKKVGVLGEVHPEVLSAFDLAEPVYLLEIDLQSLVPFITVHKTYRPIPRFPSIIRDMALIVDGGVTHLQIKRSIEAFPLVEQAEIFDVYSGGQVSPGKKSLAYRISYRSPEHTLTDEEVNEVQQQILERLGRDLGTVLRSQV
jgi:phenylalanyl-tRNA synthetase beta chain